MAKLKPSDLRKGDIVEKDGVLWNVLDVFPEKIVVHRDEHVFDLEGWEKVDMYQRIAAKQGKT
jgi:hypothetical protein